jgi:hypothetical protein
MNRYLHNQWQPGKFFDVAHLTVGKSTRKGAVSFVLK